jgi:hypothetical protein
MWGFLSFASELCRDTAQGAKEKNHRKFLELRAA